MARPLNIERRTKVAQLIMLRGSISVKELARQFDVLTETIRKDLILLEKENIISKEHGGATISSHYSESHFSDKLLKNSAVKTRLAQKALEMVPERGVVILDTGTTVLQIAKLLNLKNDLVIITNSLIAAEALENTENQLLLTGGQLRRKSMSFVGDWATRAVASIRADITFVGCDGFHEDGPCSRSYRELDVKQTIIENSEKVVLVADSSKFSRDGLYRFATFDQIDYLLTDSGITGQQRELFSSHVELIVV